MRDASVSLRSLSDSVENLQTYLQSQQVFWARGALPSLSLGGICWDRLLLTVERASLDDEDRRQFDQLQRDLDRIANRWQVAWEQKSLAEARARLNLWSAYLTDLAGNPAEASAYPYEVRNRFLAGSLIEQAGRQQAAEPLRAQLEALDQRLRGRFRSGNFVWESELEAKFPAEPYWYLYGKPPGI